MQTTLFFKMDTRANVTFFNEFAQQFFGFSQEEIIGRNVVGTIVPEIESTGRDLMELFRDIMRRPERYLENEMENIKKTGERVWILWRNSIIYDCGGSFAGILCIALDITERKRADEELKRIKELSHVLNSLSAAIRSTLDFDTIMQRVIADAAAALNADASSIGLFQGEYFVLKYGYNMPKDLVGLSLPSREVKGVHYAASIKDVVVFDDACNDDRLNLEMIRTYGIRSLMIAPFITKGTVSGAMIFYCFSSPYCFPDMYIDFIRKLSGSLSLALEDARLFAELRAAQERASFFAHALEYSSQPFASGYPDGRLMIFNQAFSDLTGYSADELRSMTWALAPPEWRGYDAKVFEELYRTGEPRLYEKEYIRKDGTQVLIEVKVHFMRDEKGNPEYYVAFLTDITEHKRMGEELKHLAHHDALTGLPNRILFTDILDRVLAQSKRHQKKLAILFLDLDGFKAVNDTLGHDIGDKLLKEVAERLKNCIRGSDTVSRIGGDEFNILLSDITSVDDAAVIPRKILAAFQQPYTFAGHELHITSSIGISLYPDDSKDTGTLLKYADIAMYHAKEHGKNKYQFYSAALNVRSSERIQMENSLRQALERDELVLYYQPQVNIDNRQVLCAEALVRWRHPVQGMLDPKHFMPLAEETGFITAIDEWVLRTACKQFKEWKETGLQNMCVTVNLSAKQFQKADLVEQILLILKETGLEPHRLHLEITESTAMMKLEQTIPSMNRLAEIGVRISIDDFVTVCSSLSYLRKLPMQKFKIDRSFVRDIVTDPDGRAIIGAVTAMAQNMKLRVLAKGVETVEQLEFLKSIGCQEIQGFLFSRPLPAEEFREMITNVK